MESLKDAYYQAYVGEAKAALRLKVYAEKAEEEGFPQIAHLFRTIARSEEVHGKRFLRLLKEIASTEENLAASFESEMKVSGVAYDAFIQHAYAEGNDAVAKVFSQNRDVEETHAQLYKKAMNHMMEENATTYYICEICGYVADGTLPDICPVCSAKKEFFTKSS